MAKKILFQTALTDVKDTDLEGVGNLREDAKGNVYRWVKNRNATAFTAKQAVCYDAGNVGTDALLKSVNMPVAADLMLAAGITLTAFEASGSDCYGWVQVQGYCNGVQTLAVSGTAIAVGDELNAVNTLAYLARVTAVGTAPIYKSTFVALEVTSDATGAEVSKDCYIRCL